MLDGVNQIVAGNPELLGLPVFGVQSNPAIQSMLNSFQSTESSSDYFGVVPAFNRNCLEARDKPNMGWLPTSSTFWLCSISKSCLCVLITCSKCSEWAEDALFSWSSSSPSHVLRLAIRARSTSTSCWLRTRLISMAKRSEATLSSARRWSSIARAMCCSSRTWT